MNIKVVMGEDIAKNSFEVCVNGYSRTYHF